MSDNSDRLVMDWVATCPPGEELSCLLEYLCVLCDWPLQCAISDIPPAGDGLVVYAARASNTNVWIKYLMVDGVTTPFVEILEIRRYDGR